MKVIIKVYDAQFDNEYANKYYIESHSGVAIRKEFCQPLDDNIRLTEERFDEMYNLLSCESRKDCLSYPSCKQCYRERLKDRGWIIETKTAKEELEEYYEKEIKPYCGRATDQLYNLAQKAIQEAEEK